MTKQPYIQSPLNYIGGKYKILPQILPLFPSRIRTFVDLFCGGCNVGINVSADRTIFNDNISYLIDLYNENLMTLLYKKRWIISSREYRNFSYR